MTIGGIAPIGGISPLASTTAVGTATPAAATSGANFGTAMAQGLQSMQQLNDRADTLAVKAATGDLTDVHNYTIAATEANLATQLTVAVRDKALAAFNQIMGMQV
jgi:flagellar hook-basal body complex protein FliE